MKKRIFFEKDTIITNEIGLQLSNFGKSSIIQCAINENGYVSRTLIGFDTNLSNWLSTYSADEYQNSASYTSYIVHTSNEYSASEGFTMEMYHMTKDWDEGFGWNLGVSDYNGFANWDSCSSTEAWTTLGGDYDTSSVITQSNLRDIENFVVDCTTFINNTPSESFMLKLSNAWESQSNFYVMKRYFSTQTETIYKPYVEVYVDDRITDCKYAFISGSTNYLYCYKTGLSSAPIWKMYNNDASASIHSSGSSSKLKINTYKSTGLSSYPTSSFTIKWYENYTSSTLLQEDTISVLNTASYDTMPIISFIRSYPYTTGDTRRYIKNDTFKILFDLQKYTPTNFYYEYMYGNNTTESSATTSIYSRMKIDDVKIKIILGPDCLFLEDYCSYDTNGYFYNIDTSWFYSGKTYTILIDTYYNGTREQYEFGKFYLEPDFISNENVTYF